jgi:PAS domain S-box-containing protein
MGDDGLVEWGTEPGVSTATGHARGEGEESRRLRALAALYRTGQRLQQFLTPAILAQEIVSVLEETLAYEYGAVLLLEEGTGRLVPFGLSDQGRGSASVEQHWAYVTSRQPLLGEGITGWVARYGQSVRLGDVRQDPRYYPLREGIRSEMCVPLRLGDQILGVVNVESSRPDAYNEDDQHVLETVAAQMAVAVQNARLYEQMQQYAEGLEARVAERTTERVQAEREAQERRLYLEAVLASAPDAIVTLDAQHRVVEWNAGAEVLFGYSHAEVIGRDLDDLITNPATLDEAKGITRRILGGRLMPPVETVRYRKDGSPVDVILAGSPILVEGELVGIVGIYTDIDERKRVERAVRRANRGLQMLSQCDEILSRARDESQLLQETCQVAVELGGYRLAWVGLAEHDEARRVRPVAQAGFEEGYLEAVRITWADNAYGRGPTGLAIRTGRPAVARNMLKDVNYAPWRQEALRRGYASSLALPLLSDGQPFGALNIYAPEPDAFDAEEVDLLAELADNLAHGIVALRTRQEHTRALEALERYAERLETLHQIDRAILEAQSPQDIASATLSRIDHLVPCRRARILAFDVESDIPTVLASRESADEYLPQEGSDAERNPDAGGGGRRAEISIPLLAEGELIGSLRVELDSVDALTQEQVEIVYEVAAPLSVTIEHARLHKRLRQHADRLEETVAQRTRELKAERDRTEAILESLGEAVTVTDVKGTVLYTNPATEALTGWAGEEAVGQNWQALQGDGPMAEVFGQVQEAMSAHQTWRGETVSLRKDDTPYDAAMTVTPLFAPDDSGELMGSVWVQRDITPLKEAERLKDRFVSNVSHELRTPLSIVTLLVGNLDRLYQRLDDEGRRKMIRSIRDQISLLNDLIDDVLEISRIDSCGVSLERQPLNLVGLVQEEMEKQMPLARRKSLTLNLGGVKALAVQGNEGQLRRAVRNLLDNAIKFTPSGGLIRCECLVQEGGGLLEMRWPAGEGLPAGRWAGLRVVDTGIGVDAERIPRLFERFYRVETEGKVPGTGLGLAITRELVELHGGYVAIASTPGEGSVFAIYLPLEG